MSRPELMTIDAAARFLDMDEHEVKRLVARRQIPFVEFPEGQVRFILGELVGWCRKLRRPVDGLVPANRMVTDLEQR